MINIRKNSIFTSYFERIKHELMDVGLSEGDASIIADCFAIADSFNVSSHGSRLLSSYIEMIKNGRFNLNPQYKILRESSSFCRIDGDNAIGILSAKYCLDYGINKVKTNGVFTIFSCNNNTFGPAFYYSLLAAEKNLICFVASNSPAQMAVPFGGIKKMIGTNPFSVCFPIKDEYPIIIDMSTSVVAKSKIMEYNEKGVLLPEGWALTSSGEPTQSPSEALNGFVMPVGGIKGYSISLAIDIISGLLSGAAFLDDVGRFYNNNNPMNVGYSLILIDPYIVYGKDYDILIKQYVEKIRNSPGNGRELILPGDDRISFHKKHKC